MDVEEQWRCIPGHEAYEASTMGRIRGGRGVLSEATMSSGYRKASLGALAQGLVHRWVMLAFRGPCPDGWYVAHKNGDRSDNRLANLMYCTPRANNLHRRFHGQSPCPVIDAIRSWRQGSRNVGVNHALCVSTEPEVQRVHTLVGQGLTTSKIAEIMGRTRAWVSHVAAGRRWRHLHPDPAIRNTRHS